MAALGKNIVQATEFVCRLHGGSKPILVRASDGLEYVVKFGNSDQGPNLPFNEAIGTELFMACGLPVPPWRQVLVTREFVTRNRGCWPEGKHGPFMPQPGLCFGSRFLRSNDATLLEILSRSSHARIQNRRDFWWAWIVDICAQHADHRQAVFLRDHRGAIRTYFIDHGYLFGRARSTFQKQAMASRYPDGRIYDVSSEGVLDNGTLAFGLNCDAIWNSVQALPQDWKIPSALSSLAQTLHRLTSPSLLRTVNDALVESIRLRDTNEPDESQKRWNLKFSILYPGVHTEILRCGPPTLPHRHPARNQL
jgi:hypothetical protein